MPAERKLAQVERIVNSRTFRNSQHLQSFLLFIARQAADDRVSEITEYAIATQVLGRAAGFDPATDTIVRTQAYRLRSKLKEYYAGEGRLDDLLIDIPKGHYVPTFLPKGAAGTVDTTGPHPLWPRVVLSGLTIVLLAVLAGALIRYWTSARHSAPDNVLNRFWTGFLGQEKRVILAYTNSVFLETETGDLLRFRGGAVADRGASVGAEAARSSALNPKLVSEAGTLFYEDAYTGVGEVVSAALLTRLMTRFGVDVIVKRSRLINMDDLRRYNVIFLGSPFENQVLAELPLAQYFRFKNADRVPFLWQGRIVSDDPNGRTYDVERDQRTLVIRTDHGIVGVLPGMTPGRRIMMLAGLTTSGTQGATEYVTSSVGVLDLLSAVRAAGQDDFPEFFQRVVRVRVARGVDTMHTHGVALHIPPAQR